MSIGEETKSDKHTTNIFTIKEVPVKGGRGH